MHFSESALFLLILLYFFSNEFYPEMKHSCCVVHNITNNMHTYHNYHGRTKPKDSRDTKTQSTLRLQ